MIAVFDTYGMAFVGVPKCMTTSVLRSFYRMEHGAEFDRTAYGANIHRFYRARASGRVTAHQFPDLAELAGLWLFTIIRNPIRRLLSVYTNRVVAHKDVAKAFGRPGLREEHASQIQGLDPMPSPDAFFRDLPRYGTLVASIRHHIDPFASYIGRDLGRYDAIFQVEDVAGLRKTLSERLGQPVVLENKQRSGHSLRFDTLCAAAQDQIITHTKDDFELLAPFYSLEDSLREQNRA